MKISVVLPAYNAEATMSVPRNSVLVQTIVADELLVMDDGSAVNTPSFQKLISHG